jgi:uncharacterized membrane protein YecN with MAPEG domain
MQVSMITAGILGLLVVILGFRISAIRRAARISLGDGGNPVLEARIRAHGNCVETVPIALILLFLAEQAYGHPWYIIALAAVLVISRLLHPVGMALPSPNLPRVAGILGTWGVTAILAFLVLARGLSLCGSCLVGA